MVANCQGMVYSADVATYSLIKPLFPLQLNTSLILAILQCFRIWDLDARGYHNSMWRMRIKGSDVMVIGFPNSEYS